LNYIKSTGENCVAKSTKRLYKTKNETTKKGNKHQSFDVKYHNLQTNLFEQVVATNA
jgi:hypothetical protein